MMNDAPFQLYQSGVLTGRAKTLWSDKIITAFACYSRGLYDFLEHNPLVDFQPAAIVNEPIRTSPNYKMFSVISAVEIDFGRSGLFCICWPFRIEWGRGSN